MKRSRMHRIVLGGGAAVVASGTAVVGQDQPAEAASFVVDNLNDAGPGSLRQAIIDANGAGGADIIAFAPGLTGPIVLTSGEIKITDSVDIQGPGSGVVSISGNNTSRVFYVYSGSSLLDVQISGATIEHGAASMGAGIHDRNENLTLDDVTLSANVATGAGGGLHATGTAFSLTVTDSTITGNTATGGGGGAFVYGVGGPVSFEATTVDHNHAGAKGGGIEIFGSGLSPGAVSISGSDFSTNSSSNRGGGLFLYNLHGDVTISGTTISGNVAQSRGGGAHLYKVYGATSIHDTTVSGNIAANRGGGLFLYKTTGGVTIDHTTVSGNTATRGGGLFLYKPHAATIVDSTITGNHAINFEGGGIFLYKPTVALSVSSTTISSNDAAGVGGGIAIRTGSAALVNAIVADNLANAVANDLANVSGGSFTASFSLVETPGAVVLGGTGNITGVDPELGVLSNNGGTTQTRVPAISSPALNAGDPAFLPPPTDDQRGVPRVVGGRIDIGAVEIVALPPGADADTTDEDVPLVAPSPGVLANDVDALPLAPATLATPPSHGTVALESDGSFIYTPDADYNGSDSFTYTVQLLDGSTGTGTVSIDVVQVIDAPVENSYSTQEDETLVVPTPGVLDNDIDAVAGTVALATEPTHGTIALGSDGSFTYTPDANYNGTDSFTYDVEMLDATTATATVSIDVVQVIDAPVENSYSTQEDEVLVVPTPGVLDNDIDAVAGTVALATEPTHGTVAFDADGSFTYTPDANYNGTDSFTYEVEMLDATTGTGTVTITVGEVIDFPGASQFVPVAPTRILDTRSSGAKPTAGSTTVVPIAGASGVPATGVTAVVLNLTATEATGAGFVTVFPTGTSRPNVSSMNLEYAGQTIPNLVTVPLGADGSVSVYSQSGTHLIADIAGYYEVQSDRRSGRFVPVAPARLLDTRKTTALAADASLDLAVTGVAGVPSSASAVVVNVTAANASAPGFVTVWPTGGARPLVSNLNITHAGQTIPNLAIVPVGADGKISIYSQKGTDVVVDVTGWFTDDSSPAADSGLFVPVGPTRILDTRPDHGLSDSGSRSVPTGIDAHETAVVLNVTATESTAPGFVTLWPSGQPMPATSNLNLEQGGQTIANAAMIGLGDNDSFDVHVQSATHMVVDIAGYFTLDE